MDQKRYDIGLAKRRKVLGDAYVDRALQNVDDFNRDFQRILTEYCWGETWGDETLAPRDLEEHLRRLEAEGLLLRIDRAINKDTELHPLVRWQFQGGLREEERRAFLFTNVIDGSGRRYETAVAVGALAASAQIYAIGM